MTGIISEPERGTDKESNEEPAKRKPRSARGARRTGRDQQAQKMTVTNYLAAATLFFIPAISVEVLSGNTTLANYIYPITFIGLNLIYGGAALLIRETTVRWNKGLASILVLAAGYGMINEGLGTKGFFNPHFYAVVEFGLENFGRMFGINVPWAINISIFHAVYSITIPILLTSALFPGTSRWLGNTAYVELLLVFGALVILQFKFAWPYVPDTSSLLLILTLIAFVILASWQLPRLHLSKWRGRPNIAMMFMMGVVSSFAFLIIPRLVRLLVPSPVVYIATLILCFVIVPVWIFLKLPEPSPRAKVALAAGLLIPVLLTALSIGAFPAMAIVLALIAAAWVRSGHTEKGSASTAAHDADSQAAAK